MKVGPEGVTVDAKKFFDELALRPDSTKNIELVCPKEKPNTQAFMEISEHVEIHFGYLVELLMAGLIEIDQVTCNVRIKLRRQRRLSYQEYLASPEWQEKRREALERAGYRCQVCNTPRGNRVLDVHHRTYERLGDELPDDLVVLCRDCHGLFHNNGKLAKPD